MYIKRRQFIQSGSLAAAGTLLIPSFLKAAGQQMPLLPNGAKILVVIQLSGGNDGLNTVIPISNDIYYRERPRLAIPNSSSLRLTDEAGLHPALLYFRELYNQGQLTILNGVGYPNPDRSHFRSMDIWQSGSPSNQYWNSGWLGRYLDAACVQCDHPTQAMEIDDMLSLALKGEQQKGIACSDPNRLYQSSRSPLYQPLVDEHHWGEEPVADYLYKTLGNTLQSADYIFSTAKRNPSKNSYPSTGLGKNLHTIANLIAGDINTRVFYVSLGSFDTHISQAAQQKGLFTELNEAVEAFVKDLKTQNRFDDVLICTFSEFGRRVAQNASNGTDHGTANNMFLIGGKLAKAGLFNPLPNLSQLVDGDMTFTIDFKTVYATLLDKWLGILHPTILREKFPLLNFL